ncbi:MAG: beta-1,4-xylanase [Pyrinomonadaceae bacterium]
MFTTTRSTKGHELTRNLVSAVLCNFVDRVSPGGCLRPQRRVLCVLPRFISPLVLLLILALPCAGCVRDRSCTFVTQSTSAGSVIPDGFGVNIHFTDPQPGEIKMLSEAGLRWVRMDIKWDSTETQPGRYDFSAYDRLTAALKPFNIRTLFILDYGNPLYDNGAPPRTEATRQAFARWAVAAAKHFAGRGALWEVYNEPNHSTFWPPQPNAQEYVALALAVGRAFRGSVPDEKLIGPATSEIDFDFLESCFKAGLLEYWSAVSIHPYRRSDPETAAQDYCRLRDMIKVYEGVQSREIQIISSEWGYSSVWRGLNEENQSQLLARTWLTNVANNISLSIWYDWRDDGLDPNEPEHHFGTVFNSYHVNREPVYDAKPAYRAAKTLTTFFSGYRFEKRLDAGGAGDYVLVFRKADDLRVAAWTTSRNHNVRIPLNAGRYMSTRHTGENLGDVTSGQDGVAINLTTAPVYLRQ